MSRHRQWRAWQFARRHKNQDMLGSMFGGNNDNAPFMKWFDKQKWYGKVLAILGVAAVIFVLFEFFPTVFAVIVNIVIFGWIIMMIAKIFF